MRHDFLILQTHQRRIDVINRKELVVHLMNLLVLQSSFFKISECKVKQRIATQHAANCSLQNVRDFIVENLCRICVLELR